MANRTINLPVTNKYVSVVIPSDSDCCLNDGESKPLIKGRCPSVIWNSKRSESFVSFCNRI